MNTTLNQQLFSMLYTFNILLYCYTAKYFDESNILLIRSWNTDEEFGRQILNGVNPTTICLCKEFPTEFAHAEKEIFTNGETAENMIKVN